jgi:hypothetical protein
MGRNENKKCGKYTKIEIKKIKVIFYTGRRKEGRKAVRRTKRHDVYRVR